jgi:hypothetical protein
VAFRAAAAVLGRFVYALNLFCKDNYGMDYVVRDYWIYEFAKVRSGRPGCPNRFHGARPGAIHCSNTAWMGHVGQSASAPRLTS